MTAKVVPLPIRTHLICSACGASGEGSCRCGASYVSAKQRVAEYDKAKPGQSTRGAAAELGMSNSTVSEARSGVRHRTPEAGSGGDIAEAAPNRVTGRDGKSYRASKPKKADDSINDNDEMPTAEEAEESQQQDYYDQACMLLGLMAYATRQKFFAHIRRKYREK